MVWISSGLMYNSFPFKRVTGTISHPHLFSSLQFEVSRRMISRETYPNKPGRLMNTPSLNLTHTFSEVNKGDVKAV